MNNKFLKPLPYVLTCFFVLTTHRALAGVDVVCEPTVFAQMSNNYDSCSNLPILTPANDNQVNMTLLLSDMGLAQIKVEQPHSSFWDTSYGVVPFEVESMQISNTRPNYRQFNQDPSLDADEFCVTSQSGADAFILQVNQLAIPDKEKNLLIATRKKLQGCDNKLEFIKIDSNWNKLTQQYASYLNGSIAFYATNFSTAGKIYTALTQVNDAWLKETAYYMQTRSSLNDLASSAKGDYGDIDYNKIDQVKLKQFFNLISNYLKLYPRGQYAASARGFLRRGYWFAQQNQMLVNEFSWQFTHPNSSLFNLNMKNVPAEIDRKIFTTDQMNSSLFKDPFFLSTYDLMHMRSNGSENYQPITWAALSAQKQSFSDQPELFNYLQANHLFFIQKKPAEALKLLQPLDPAQLNTYLQLSQYYLRGIILEKTLGPAQVTAYWQAALKQSKNKLQYSLFETQLTNNLVIQNKQNEMLAMFPKLKQANLQLSWLTQFANASSLEYVITHKEFSSSQKNAALYVLLDKALHYQDYTTFNKAYAWLPKNATQYTGFNSTIEAFRTEPLLAKFVWNGSTISPTLSCPSLLTITQNMQQQPQNLVTQLCLGEYVRQSTTNYIYVSGYDLAEPRPENYPVPFTGKAFARGDTYVKIMQNSNDPELKAYALYRAINCYAPASVNTCENKDVPKSVRKQWFNELKQNYPNTTWAKSLKYYW